MYSSHLFHSRIHILLSLRNISPQLTCICVSKKKPTKTQTQNPNQNKKKSMKQKSLGFFTGTIWNFKNFLIFILLLFIKEKPNSLTSILYITILKKVTLYISWCILLTGLFPSLLYFYFQTSSSEPQLLNLIVDMARYFYFYFYPKLLF